MDIYVCVGESGRVTIDADDRKAEFLFQTEFSSVPQVLFSICGYDFDMEARKGLSYNVGAYVEPNAIGVSVVGGMYTHIVPLYSKSNQLIS